MHLSPGGYRDLVKAVARINDQLYGKDDSVVLGCEASSDGGSETSVRLDSVVMRPTDYETCGGRLNQRIKGIVQRKLRWVEIGINRWVLL